MKQLKFYTFLITFILLVVGCGSYPTKNNTTAKEEPVVIANEALQYEIIIIDIGFTLFLNTQARPIEYYSESYLKNKNILYVNVWNNRVRDPQQFDSNIYENEIDYQANVDYGLDVNYKLYLYFKFAEQKYKMKLNY
tara:strand:- start:7 stop:417 length:411 start_codon:yes stop_codon:yes gene_type:complete